jgi:hypothetical protein
MRNLLRFMPRNKPDIAGLRLGTGRATTLYVTRDQPDKPGPVKRRNHIGFALPYQTGSRPGCQRISRAIYLGRDERPVSSSTLPVRSPDPHAIGGTVKPTERPLGVVT